MPDITNGWEQSEFCMLVDLYHVGTAILELWEHLFEDLGLVQLWWFVEEIEEVLDFFEQLDGDSFMQGELNLCALDWARALVGDFL